MFFVLRAFASLGMTLGLVGIAERAGQPADPHTPEVEETLNAVESAALEIANTVYGFIPLPS